MQSIMLGVVFIVLLSWLILYTYLFKEKLGNMVGMVLAMTLGMVVGLSTGALLAILYPTFIFEVTIISMLIGGFIGVISGYPFSLVAILDGLMSGIMGGMMGAMLGVMITPEYQNQLLSIMSLLTVGIFFFVYLIQTSELVKAYQRNSFFFQPLPYFLVACFFIYSFHGYSFVLNNEMIDHSSHAPKNELMIHASEYDFGPEQIKIPPNEEVTLTLLNTGLEEHDFEIKGLDYHLHAKPGTSNSQRVVFEKPGIYEAICTLPGHKEAGMVATILVIDS
ncbi:cupredoxin domain-containing protein [Alkalihalobacillus oceani]|uniref:Cupredoxin domain-containing protein n=1 Tax=Halalkalibacter oceani TaxID=1653776 RepID=A0A9X2DS32_9BACI|nr:cupredoxin domain-containing protein [Halalkalibacter oceani]MCM3715443.1 cupredoxin domain-containing protein [Halalkalibacter oceani]MCM3763041.1 cupredoxin domain-containing protein [Halalkalibacter oceani]